MTLVHFMLVYGDLMYPYIKLFNFYIPSYGLCICMAVFLYAVLVFKKAYKINIDSNDLIILSAVSIGCGILSGNLLYIVITYNFETLYKQIVVGDFSFLQNSGIVFYGGLIGGLAGGIITAKMLRIKMESVEICVIPYIPLGHAIGRIGCLLAGCCYGLPYKGIFAVSTVCDLSHRTYFPIQLIEALYNLLIMGVLLFYVKRKRTKYSVIRLYLIMYSCLRFFWEFFRGDTIRGSFLIFSTSQWISLIIFLLCFILGRKNSLK